MAIFIFLVSAVEVKRNISMRKVAKLIGNYKDFHKGSPFFMPKITVSGHGNDKTVKKMSLSGLTR